MAAGEWSILLREGFDGVLHAFNACAIAHLHAKVGSEPVAGRACGKSSRAVELVRVLFHPFHYGVEAGLAVPAAFVDEDLLSWVGHVVDCCGVVLRQGPTKDGLRSVYLYLVVHGQDQETYNQEANFTWNGLKVVLCSLPVTAMLRREVECVHQWYRDL